MKLVSFRHRGEDTYGVVSGDGIVDLGRRLGPVYPDIRSLLQADGLDRARRAALSAPDVGLSEVEFLPVIPNANKIICIGLNYKAHRDEVGRKPADKPTVFMRFSDSQAAHRKPLLKPTDTQMFDYEGELAVIIGKAARFVPEDRAFDYVAGYSCYNDGSVRDWQNHTSQWAPGKNFPNTGGFGPWMVTADEIPDITALTLTTRVNGTVVQESGIDLMLFPIPSLIAYITAFTELRPGDVISTGTPGGVGWMRKPQLFLSPGDRVEVEITSIGTLENEVAASESIRAA